MRAVQASIVVVGRAVEAEQLWYDRDRWASWIDGFGKLVKVDDDWPLEGSRRLWDAPPAGGRGRVSERVTRYEVRVGQHLELEDATLHGVERVTFEPGPDGTRITLELEVEPKQRVRPLPAYLLRRRLTASLQRTLVRFSYELQAERDPSLGR
jgi:hypothetical protein